VTEKRFDARPLAHDVSAINADAAAGRSALANEHADGGGLSCTVGAQQPEQLAAADVQIQTVHGRKRAVDHTQPGDANRHFRRSQCSHHEEVTLSTKST